MPSKKSFNFISRLLFVCKSGVAFGSCQHRPSADIAPKAIGQLFLLRQWPCHLMCAVDDELCGRIGGAILETDNEDGAQPNR
jgi:hypothetical protein